MTLHALAVRIIEAIPKDAWVGEYDRLDEHGEPTNARKDIVAAVEQAVRPVLAENARLHAFRVAWSNGTEGPRPKKRGRR